MFELSEYKAFAHGEPYVTYPRRQPSPINAAVNFKKYSWGWYNEIREMSYDSKLLHG
jgi:hypothetical protein